MAIGHQRGCWAHGTGQHHGLAGIQHLVQEPGSFLQRVGPMGDDDPPHLRILQMVGAAQCQCTPQVTVHVLAVDLRHLLCQQLTACSRLQARYRQEQLGHTHLGSRVANVVPRLRRSAGNRAPRA